jgi:hypothetical protein
MSAFSKLAVIAISTLAVSLAMATTYTFAPPSGTEGEWGVQTNWSPQGRPGQYDTAIVPAGYTCYVVEDEDIGTLIIEADESSAGELRIVSYDLNVYDYDHDLDGTIYMERASVNDPRPFMWLWYADEVNDVYGGRFTGTGAIVGVRNGDYNYGSVWGGLDVEGVEVRGSLLVEFGPTVNNGTFRVDQADDGLAVSNAGPAITTLTGTGAFITEAGTLSINGNIAIDPDAPLSFEVSGGHLTFNHYGDLAESELTFEISAGLADIYHPQGEGVSLACAALAISGGEMRLAAGNVLLADSLSISGGTLHFLGDLDQETALTVTGDLGGRIFVDGALAEDAEVIVTGDVDVENGAGIVIDFDGYNDNNDWLGTIEVDDEVYEWQLENYPEVGLYRTTPCRADMNNDGDVNGYDIDPFYLALQSCEDFAAAYKLHGGSCWYHADANSDSYVDGFDIDPFWELVYLGGCYPDGPPEPRGGGLGGEGSELTPETVAGMILANVPSGHLDAVRQITVLRIAAGGDDDATAFWQEVLTLLSE